MLLLSDHAGALAFCDQNRVHLSVLCEQYFPVRNSGLCAVSVIRKMEAAAAPFPGYYFFCIHHFLPHFVRMAGQCVPCRCLPAMA